MEAFSCASVLRFLISYLHTNHESSLFKNYNNQMSDFSKIVVFWPYNFMQYIFVYVSYKKQPNAKQCGDKIAEYYCCGPYVAFLPLLCSVNFN
jgi:hypothetical protein